MKTSVAPLIKAAKVLLLIAVVVSCNDNLNTDARLQNSTIGNKTKMINGRVVAVAFDGTEGDPIDPLVASNWIDNYVKQNKGQVIGSFFSNKSLTKMLSKVGCIGIRFYYSRDVNTNPVLLAASADETGNDLRSQFQSKGLTSNYSLSQSKISGSMTGMESDSVSVATAIEWKNNYLSSKPQGIIAHFFGYEIIHQILSESSCVGIRCYYSLDMSGTQKLLLVGINSQGQTILPGSVSNGRTDDGTIADNSFPCPTLCSGN
jgi:hypothetical protein